MSKVYFRYGTMNSSKSLNLLATAHNYESQGKKVLLLKPSLDTRSESGFIESRAGLYSECIDINKSSDIISLFLMSNQSDVYHCILVDESQFLTKQQVLQLTKIADIYDIPVICYGLKNSYIKGELFEGSKALLYYADKIEEIKTICSCEDCNSKATLNLRLVNGEPIYTGEIVTCGDTNPTGDYFMPVCRKHYFNPIITRK